MIPRARMSGAVETELRKLEEIVPGVQQADEQMDMVSGTLKLFRFFLSNFIFYN